MQPLHKKSLKLSTKKITQTLHTKNHATSPHKKNHATSRKINHAAQVSEWVDATSLHTKITQPLHTKKKLHNFFWLKFMTKIMWPKKFWLKFCNQNFVTKVLWQKICDQHLWPKLCDQNCVTKILWLKVCDHRPWIKCTCSSLLWSHIVFFVSWKFSFPEFWNSSFKSSLCPLYAAIYVCSH